MRNCSIWKGIEAMEVMEIENEKSQHPAVESVQSLTSEQVDDGAENLEETAAKSSEVNNKEAENPVDAAAISPGVDTIPLEASSKPAELNNGEAENPTITTTELTEMNNGEAGNPIVASSELSEMDTGEAENLKVSSAELSEMNNGEAENLKVASAELSEKNNEEPGNAMGASAKSSEVNTAAISGKNPTKAETSKKRAVKSLKAKSIIMKKTASKVPLEAEKLEGNPQTQQKNKKKNRRLSLKNRGNKDAQVNNSNANAREENLVKDDAEIKPTGKSQVSKENQEKVSDPSSSEHNQKSENERGVKGKRPRRRNKKGKLDVKEDKQPDVKEDEKGKKKKKEKIGGLIFMCSAKTKPDCFRYQVMGVTSNKKDLVLGVRPGLKLFLYDFDLKLMYGVYKASSAGGMKLEPKAFGGSFPIQVRFSVHKDCVPLPESVFKKAIKDNYNGKNKFDIELSVQQVRKLIALFRPVGFQPVQPAAARAHLPSRAGNRDREGKRPRDSRPHNDNTSYPSRSHKRERERERERGRDKHPLQVEVLPTRREQPPRDLYMTEKEYRTYGLHRERRSLTPPRVSSSYHRDVERELHIRRPVSPYEPVPLHREPILIDPLYPESHSYSRTSLRSAVPSGSAVAAMDSYTRDPYYSYSRSSHLLPSRREEVALDSYYDRRRDVYAGAVDPLRRRETEEMDMDRLYMKYSVNPPSDHRHVYRSSRPEDPLPPVSSRYSFSGPSYR